MAERKPYPSEQQDRLIIRFPDGMRDRIAALAKANGRSMNAEIISMIEASFRRTERPTDEEPKSDLAHEIRELRGVIEKLQTEFEEMMDVVLVPDFTRMTKPEGK
jgi:plasmid stability protein